MEAPTPRFTEPQWREIALALQTAAVQYATDATTNHNRIRAHFERQAHNAQDYAIQILRYLGEG
jgi:hypothetical protein